MGHPSIPLSVISKAAELQFHYTVDKVVAEATGIQPKFPYMVDSFERRSEASLLRISDSSSCRDNSKGEDDRKHSECIDSSCFNLDDNNSTIEDSRPKFRLPFGGWFHQK
ncbi:hypothetical protein Ahy_B03g065434 isoform G [Arachis hypogaea]|uniref:Uncharacterized protein n=1 Tax=Arachis hypogaea TaxID=3818 RepID=A0A445A1M0_ARAHY|nr:hypothetical protein Ahy_B03g065434 isoform G [Arachis hypogaea]